MYFEGPPIVGRWSNPEPPGLLLILQRGSLTGVAHPKDLLVPAPCMARPRAIFRSTLAMARPGNWAAPTVAASAWRHLQYLLRLTLPSPVRVHLSQVLQKKTVKQCETSISALSWNLINSSPECPVMKIKILPGHRAGLSMPAHSRPTNPHAAEAMRLEASVSKRLLRGVLGGCRPGHAGNFRIQVLQIAGWF